MTQEHKCRAWVDKEIIEGRLAEMYEVCGLDWDDDGVVCGKLFSPATQTFHVLNAEWFKLQWCSGFDVKGGLVYQGDILKCRELWVSKKDESVVEENVCQLLAFYRQYRWEFFGMVFGSDGERVNTISLYLHDHGEYSWGNGFQDWKRDFGAKTRWLDFEIIGNEDANPELWQGTL